MEVSFDWNPAKDVLNRAKHGVSFETAKRAFSDPNNVVQDDPAHSWGEERHFCFGKVDDAVLTVRFTYRQGVVRIIGAGYWRRGRRIYEKENSLHGRSQGDR